MDISKYLEIKDFLKNISYQDEIYCVGGCVRDFILERDIKDIDLVVISPKSLIDFLGNNDLLLGDHTVIFERWETFSIILKEFPDVNIEITELTNGDINLDCFERDFTINALYQSVDSPDILDPTDKGLLDLHNKLIRPTGGRVFNADPLRALRAIRFKVCLEFSLTLGIFNDIPELSSSFFWVSNERIREEMNKILLSNHPDEGLKLIYSHHLLSAISPEFFRMTSIPQNRYHFGTVWEHTIEVVKHCTGKSLTVLWAALLHDIGKIETLTIDDEGMNHFYGHEKEGERISETVLRRLKFSKDRIKEIKTLVGLHMIFKGVAPGIPKASKLRKLQYELGEDLYWKVLDLIEADNLSHAPGYCIPDQIEKIRKKTKNMKTLFTYTLPISGEDIMRVRKIDQGKEVGAWLKYALNLVFGKPDISKESILKSIKNERCIPSF